jgi:hypothetical protein
MKSILDPTFRYTNSASTDIRKTFARVRREQEAERKAREANSNKQPIPIKRTA